MVKELKSLCVVDGKIEKSLLLLALACFVFSPISTFIRVALTQDSSMIANIPYVFIEILSILFIRLPLFRMTSKNTELLGTKKVMIIAILYFMISI